MDFRAFRSRFKIFERKTYVNSCSQGALSDAVEEGMREYLRSWHEGGSPWDLWVQRYEEARGLFAQLINARPEEVAVLPSASAGMNSIASALDFKKRSRVVMGEFEFPTMGHVWLAQEPRGAQVEFVAAQDGAIPIEGYRRAVNERTAIVPLTHVCFMNGYRSPVSEVVRIAHDAGAYVMLDDYQDCGTRPIDVKAADVDFYVAGTLKYLLGPAGLAFLYVRESLIPLLNPTISGWFAQSNIFAFDVRRHDPADSARRFEAGTPAVPNCYGAMPGVRLLLETGLAPVAEHIGQLAQAALLGARNLGIAVKTPANSAGPLVVMRSHDAGAMVARLAARDIIGSSRHDGLRVSFHAYNSTADVDTVLAALQENLDLMVRV